MQKIAFWIINFIDDKAAMISNLIIETKGKKKAVSIL
jgi:hypothetical protein